MYPKPNQDKNVIHVINGLGLGGAETMLYNVVKYGTAKSEFRSIVISLGEGDHFVSPLRELGVEVVELRLRKYPIRTLREFFKLARRSNVICSWSYHSNLLSIGPKLLFRPRLSWIINHEDTARETNKLVTWMIMRICAWLTWCADSIAYNGAASRKSHAALGYSSKEESIVPNGCDTDIYSPAAKSDNYLTETVGDAVAGKAVVLSAGRWHPIKDHATLIEAFALVRKRSDSPVVAVLCGPNVDSHNLELIDLVKKHCLELGKDIFLLGPRDDLPQLMANCDLYVLHSKAEAFPNVLVQAMSSGARVVSTNVGVVSELTNGAINPVPPSSPEPLAEEIFKQLTSQKPQLDLVGRSLRRIIKDDYSISNVVHSYEDAIFGNVD